MTSTDNAQTTTQEKAVSVVRQQTAPRDAAPLQRPPTSIVLDEVAAIAAPASRPLHDLTADLLSQGRVYGVYVPERRPLVRHQYATLDALNAAIDRGEA